MKRFLLFSVGVALLSGCSGGHPASPDSTTVAAKGAGVTAQSFLVLPKLPDWGSARGRADGDIKNGPLEILRVRIRQGGTGFYAAPGGTYRVRINEPVELWVEWASDQPVTGAPRLVVDWSLNPPDNIHCGPCLLTRTYRADGRYQVTVTLDDRAGGVTKRTFHLQTTGGAAPQAYLVAESDGPFWVGTIRFQPFNNQDVTVTITGIVAVRVDTGEAVASNPLFPIGTIPAALLPFDYLVGASLPCAFTGGADFMILFNIDLVSADGTRAAVEVRTRNIPCS